MAKDLSTSIKTIAFILLILPLQISAQKSLPFQGSRTDMSRFKQSFSISYINNQYYINEESPISNAKTLGEELCKKRPQTNDFGINQQFSYINLKIEGNAKMDAVDSLLNELSALSLFNVYFQTKNGGFFYVIPPTNELKRRTLAKDSIDLPAVKELNSCKPMQGIPLQPATSLDKPFIPLIVAKKIETVYGKKIYYLSKNNGKNYLNNSKKSKKSLRTNIEAAVLSGDYFFMLDIHDYNTYEEFLEMLDTVFQTIYKKRDAYIKAKLTKESTPLDRSYLHKQSKQIFQLRFNFYTPSDKKCAQILSEQLQ